MSKSLLQTLYLKSRWVKDPQAVPGQFEMKKLSDDALIMVIKDDETNTSEIKIIEWNIINTNFVQNDYPTATKLIPAADQDILYVLKQVVNQSNVFSEGKFAGIKNPFTDLFVNLDRIKNVSGSLDSGLISRVYEYLDQVGIQIFCATSED